VLRGLTQPTDDDWTIIFDAAETNWILFYSSSSSLLRGSDGSSPVAMCAGTEAATHCEVERAP
jgi:hypothetical protein